MKMGKHTVHKKHKARSVIAIFLCVLAVLFLVLICGGYAFFQSKLTLLQHSDGTVQQEGTINENDSDVRADDDAMKAATEGLEERDAIQAEGEVTESDDVFNVLLIGTDERTTEFSDNARGDSCMLLSINKATGKIHLVSFERGTGVPILSGQYEGQWDWLTHTFRYGGANLMMQEIRECYKVDVTHYVRVNFATFEQAVNSVGGVDIELTELECRGLNNQTYTNAVTHTTVHPGMNHLDGYNALQYARQRYIDSDWHRVERQRNVIKAVAQNLKTMNPLELNQVLDDVLPLVQTNLTEREITGLLLQAPKLLQSEIDDCTIPQHGTYGSMIGMGGRHLFAVDFATNAEYLKQLLYEEE